MKKLTVSVASLPIAAVIGYIIALYAEHWSTAYANSHPGIGFGSIGLQFQIITPAIVVLALTCWALNYYIYTTTKVKSGDKSAVATRLTAAAVVTVSTLILIPFIYSFGRMLFG